MNYYIQGNKEKADQIKAAFKKLGYDVTGFDMCNDNVLFFTYKLQGGGKVISTTNANLYTASIIKTHPDYKELPIESKFKAEDWIVSTRNQSLTYRILETNIPNELGKLDYKVEIYSDGIYEKTCSISSSKMDEWGRLWKIADAEDGDVLVSWIDNPFIYDGNIEFSSAGAYVGVSRNGRIRLDMFPSKAWTSIKDVKPATKEQREMFFAKLREAGYEWDADKKELRKIKPHYDISNFKPFDKVLVRFCDGANWCCALFSHYCTRGNCHFVCSGGSVTQCIPYNDDTKHLLGTTDMCDEMYINWRKI